MNEKVYPMTRASVTVLVYRGNLILSGGELSRLRWLVTEAEQASSQVHVVVLDTSGEFSRERLREALGLRTSSPTTVIPSQSKIPVTSLLRLFWFLRRGFRRIDNAVVVDFWSGGLVALAVRLRLLRITQIHWSKHGILEEIVFKQRPGRLWHILCALRQRVAGLLESQIAHQSSTILVVSEGLKEYVCRRFGVGERSVVVVPTGLRDGGPSWREISVSRWQVRASLGIGDDELCYVYNGSYHAWQCPDDVLAYYRYAREVQRKCRLLILSNHSAIWEAAVAEFLGPADRDSVVVLNVAIGEVARVLHAGDVGIVFRRPHIVNYVAWPTKISDYLWSGMPILTSAGWGPIPLMVEANGLGVTIELDDRNTWRDAATRLARMGRDDGVRESVVQWARRNLSRDTYAHVLWGMRTCSHSNLP